jgi:hypothetical protein
MKIVKKWILLLVVTLSILSNAQAYNEDNLTQKIGDDSLISDLEGSALTFNTLDKIYDLKALGFPSTSNNMNTFNNVKVNKPESQSIEVLFDSNSFSTESGFLNQADAQEDERVYFIKGSYKLLQQENFSLFVTAKIESLNSHSIYQFYSNDFVSRETSAININGAKSYARLEILGEYSINNNWSLTGGLTSTALESTSNSQPAYNLKNEQVALFGTIYTF